MQERDLKGMPPLLILTTEFDVLRDEGIAYGKKLEQAYNPMPIPLRSAQMGFQELLCFTILPKVMWIGASVCTVGILFMLLDISKGYEQMLLIGSTTLITCLLITGYFFLTKRSYVQALIPVLYRVVPVLLVTAYVLLS